MKHLPACLTIVLTSTFCTKGIAADRPNIVWLTSEDNSIHFSRLYSEDGISMPAIESPAEHGLVFEHAFSNAPVCSVARTTSIQAIQLQNHLPV